VIESMNGARFVHDTLEPVGRAGRGQLRRAGAARRAARRPASRPRSSDSGPRG